MKLNEKGEKHLSLSYVRKRHAIKLLEKTTVTAAKVATINDWGKLFVTI